MIRRLEEALLKLKRPPYPTVVGTAGYFFIQAGHRETAIEHAIQVIAEHAARARESFAGDPVMAELEAPMESWVIESLIQGAWPREYHEWEKATKGYFEGQHKRNGSSKPDWKAKIQSPGGAVSHVDRVRAHSVNQHTAFAAKSRTEVDAFYAAALKAGGIDNGGPGLRKQYAPGYYAAFVFDPDGNNIEAVYRRA